MPLRLADLAVRFGCELHGDPGIEVDRVATLQGAEPGSLAFLANPRYIRYLESTRASAVVLGPESADRCPVAALVCANPYAAYARIAQLLYPSGRFAGGRHPAAVVDPGAQVDASAWIAAGAYLEDGASIGAGCWVGPGSIVMGGAQLGAGSTLVANVTVCREVRIGERCLLHPGVVLGADGFGQAPDSGGYVKVPQVGGVVIGDDVEIGANSTVDRGAIEDTVIEDGVKIDNLVQIGHNTHVGAHTVIAGCVGISGSARIGRRCMIGGQVGIAGHLEICDDVVLTGRTMVISSIREPGMYSSGITADEARRFRRNSARFHQLDELARRLRRLERAAAGDEREER